MTSSIFSRKSAFSFDSARAYSYSIARVVARHQDDNRLVNRMGDNPISEEKDGTLNATILLPTSVAVFNDMVNVSFPYDDDADESLNFEYHSTIEISFFDYDSAQGLFADIVDHDKSTSVRIIHNPLCFSSEQIGTIEFNNVQEAILLGSGFWVVLSYHEKAYTEVVRGRKYVKDLYSVTIISDSCSIDA